MCQFKSGEAVKVNDETVVVKMVLWCDRHVEIRKRHGICEASGDGLDRFHTPVELVPVKGVTDNPSDWLFIFDDERPEWWKDGMTEQAITQILHTAMAQIIAMRQSGWWEGDAYFSSLTSAVGLENLASVGGDAYFYSLTSAERSKIPVLNAQDNSQSPTKNP